MAADSGNAQELMLGSVPGAQALGRGPVPDGGFSRHDYRAGGSGGRLDSGQRRAVRRPSRDRFCGQARRGSS